MRVARYWHRLPREVVECPNPESVHSQVGWALRDLV